MSPLSRKRTWVVSAVDASDFVIHGSSPPLLGSSSAPSVSLDQVQYP